MAWVDTGSLLEPIFDVRRIDVLTESMVLEADGWVTFICDSALTRLLIDSTQESCGTEMNKVHHVAPNLDLNMTAPRSNPFGLVSIRPVLGVNLSTGVARSVYLQGWRK